LSNGKGIINTLGVLLLNLQKEGYYYNGVSFYESFEKFKSTSLKIRPSGMVETLNICNDNFILFWIYSSNYINLLCRPRCNNKFQKWKLSECILSRILKKLAF